MAIRRIGILCAALVVSVFARIVFGQTPLTFEQRQQQYFQDCRNGVYQLQRNGLWGYLELGIHPDWVHTIIQAMVYGAKNVIKDPSVNGYDDATVGFFYSVHLDNVLALRVLLQYPDKISSDDYDLLVREFKKQHIDDSGFLIAGNPNQKICAVAGTYLYCEHFDPDAEFVYGVKQPDGSWTRPSGEYMGAFWDDFTYNGHTYKRGGRYNVLQFTRDWLMRRFDSWVRTKEYSSPDYREFDSNWYTHPFLTALNVLSDFAEDPDVKNRARMMLDFWLLDYFMDYSADQHGGAQGRASCPMGEQRSSSEFLFFGFKNRMRPVFPSRDALVSPYRTPDIIQDLVDLSDEPDDYWHIHMEYNPMLHEPGKGKVTYVTKYFNLGGGCATKGWQLNVAPDPESGEVPIVIFVGRHGINLQETNMNWEAGGPFFQYRNVVASEGSTTYILSPRDRFDRDEQSGGWRFLKKGKVMIAIGAGVEVDLEGVDYDSWEDFKRAVRANTHLSLQRMVTSKGEVIENDGQGGLKGGQRVWNFPFKRMETIDYAGNHLISWRDNVMVLSKHGRRAVYDFNAWQFWEDADALDLVPPEPPSQLQASEVAEDHVVLVWLPGPPASDGDEAVRYLVKRDGVVVGTTDQPTYRDENLFGGMRYRYTVLSMDKSGNLSRETSQLVVDTPAPAVPLEILSLEIVDLGHLKIEFNLNVDRATAENTHNYQIEPPITVLAAKRLDNPRFVELTTERHEPGRHYTLRVSGVWPVNARNDQPVGDPSWSYTAPGSRAPEQDLAPPSPPVNVRLVSP